MTRDEPIKSYYCPLCEGVKEMDLYSVQLRLFRSTVYRYQCGSCNLIYTENLLDKIAEDKGLELKIKKGD